MATEVAQTQQQFTQLDQQQPQQTQYAPAQSLGERLRKTASNKLRDVLDKQIVPMIEKKIEEEASKGMFQCIVSPEDFRDHPQYQQIYSYFSDRTCQDKLLDRFYSQDLDAELYYENNLPHIRVSWGEEEEEEEEGGEGEELGYDQQGQVKLEEGMQQPIQPQQPQAAQQQLAGGVGMMPTTVQRREQAQQPPQGAVGTGTLQPMGQVLPGQPAAGFGGGGIGMQAGGAGFGGVGLQAGGPAQAGFGAPMFGGRGRGFGFRGRGRGFGRGGLQFQQMMPARRPAPGGGVIVNPRLEVLGQMPYIPSPMPNTLRGLLENIPIQQIMVENWARKRLVLVGDRQPLDKALQRLRRHNILSLPVLDEENGKIIGILDVLDIVNYMRDVFDQPTTPAAKRWNFVLKNIRELIESSKKRAVTISSGASLWDGLKELAKGHHRLMVLDKLDRVEIGELTQPEEAVTGILSQSDIVRFVARNIEWMANYYKKNMTVAQLNLGRKDVLTVHQEIPAYDAFRVIKDNQVAGVAIVDDNGKLVANLSASDLRGMTRTNFQALFRPVREFLERDRRRGWWQKPHCCEETDTLDKVFLNFGTRSVHRLFTVDDMGRPSRVIVLTDILQQLLQAD
jgi:CBS domain-containing protein